MKGPLKSAAVGLIIGDARRASRTQISSIGRLCIVLVLDATQPRCMSALRRSGAFWRLSVGLVFLVTKSVIGSHC
jgi:hypothetical protein